MGEIKKQYKYIFISLVGFFLLGLIFLSYSLTQKKTVLKPKAEGGLLTISQASSPLFFENFNGENNQPPILDNSLWSLLFSSGSNVSLNPDIYYGLSGKSLLLDYKQSDSPLTNPVIIERNNVGTITNAVFRTFFYDDVVYGAGTTVCDPNSPLNVKGTFFAIYQNEKTDPPNIESEKIHSFLGVNSDLNVCQYVLRRGVGPGDTGVANDILTKIPRTSGWHMFEFIVTSEGTYAKIDNNLIEGNYSSQTQVKRILYASTWKRYGRSNYDNFYVYQVDNRPYKEQWLDVFSDFYNIYKDTTFVPNASCCSADGNYFRSIANTSLAFYFLGKSLPEGDASKALILNKSMENFLDLLNNANWQNIETVQSIIWAKGITLRSFLYNTVLMWNDLSVEQKAKAREKILKAANSFFVDPIGDGYVGNWRWQYPMSADGTEEIVPGWPSYNSAAEENAWQAGFLALVGNFFPDAPMAEKYKQRAKCFAYYTISVENDFANEDPECRVYKRDYDNGGRERFSLIEPGSIKVGEIKPRIEAKTVAITGGVWNLYNHGQVNPAYANSAIQDLAIGGLSYIWSGQPIPNEFKHNVLDLYNNFIIDKIETNPLTYFYTPAYCGSSNESCKRCQYDQNTKQCSTSPCNYCSIRPPLSRDWMQGAATFYYNAPLVWSYLSKYNGYSLSTQNWNSWNSLFSNKSLFLKNIQAVYTLPVNETINEDTNSKKFGTPWLLNSVITAENYIPAYWSEFSSAPSPIKSEFKENFTRKQFWNSPSGTWKFEFDTSIKKTGTFSLKLSDISYDNIELDSYLLPIKENKVYKVSYWVKTENIEHSGTSSTGAMVFYAEYNYQSKEEESINSSNRIFSSHPGSGSDPLWGGADQLMGTNGWTYKEYIFTTHPGAKYLRLRLSIGGNSKGTVWFDDVKLEEYLPVVPTNTPIPTRTLTPVPTSTSTPTPTRILTATPTPTRILTPTPTNTLIPTATRTPVPTNTPYNSPTPTLTPTLTPVPTPTTIPIIRTTVSGFVKNLAGRGVIGAKVYVNKVVQLKDEHGNPIPGQECSGTQSGCGYAETNNDGFWTLTCDVEPDKTCIRLQEENPSGKQDCGKDAVSGLPGGESWGRNAIAIKRKFFPIITDNIFYDCQPSEVVSQSTLCNEGTLSKTVGNANCDSIIDGKDFGVLLREFFLRTGILADFNLDGKVDTEDYKIWRSNRGT